jgi:2-keto-3-deoxy-6-phosphogluconate aldolase
MLCGGATMDNLSGYAAAGAAGILVGSAIMRRELIANEDWASIAGLAGQFVLKLNGLLAEKNVR